MKEKLLAFIDLETTGLDPLRHEIIEVGVVMAKQTGKPDHPLEEIESFDIQVKPEKIEKADPEALRVAKYHERTWERQVSLLEAVDILDTKLRGSIMVAQNVTFDHAFLLVAFQKVGKSLDNTLHYHKMDAASMAFSLHYWNKGYSRFSLRELTEQAGLKNSNAHTALADAKVTFEVVNALLKKMTAQDSLF